MGHFPMFKVLTFMLIMIMSVFAQTTWEQGEDITNSNGNQWVTTDDDSVYFSGDTLLIFGADTAYIFVNTGKTSGMITYKGEVYAPADDSAHVWFDIAKLEGRDYAALDANATETYYHMDSSFVDSSGTDHFYFYPFQNTNLQDYNHTTYYLLRMKGRAAYQAKIIMREERTRAY